MKKSSELSKKGRCCHISNVISSVVMGIFVLISVCCLSACSSDNNEDEQANIESLLLGKDWKYGDGSGIYTFYKNHLMIYEGMSIVSAGGVSETPMFFGSWRMEGSNLVTNLTIGHPSAFDTNSLLKNLRDVYTNYSPSFDVTYPKKSYSSSSYDKYPYIVGTASDGKLYALGYYKLTNDYSDDTDHDVSLRGTWYLKVTQISTGKTVLASLTFNADNTMLTKIEGEADLSTRYTTKNGHVYIDDFLDKGNEEEFIYLNVSDLSLKLHEIENGYLSIVLYREKDAAK